MRRAVSLDTALVHAGRPSVDGAVVPPIFQTANYEQADPDAYADIRYLRLSNSPNHKALAKKLSAITGAEDALVTASGMAAIATTLLTCLQSGDHILAQQTVYGGTQSFFDEELPRLGISVTQVDPADPSGWPIQENTRLVYLEAISNPLMEVGDVSGAVAFARQHGLMTVLDNTFASPVNFRPLALGVDLEIHSATKYLNGHSDIVAGVIAGRADRISAAHHRLNHFGGTLDPNSCFLLDRGLKTLALRVRRQNGSALKIARFLADHPRVSRVRYPGLPDDPHHRLASAQFDGFGGMLAFHCDDADAVLDRLTLPIRAASLGGVETLAVMPARSSHLGMSAEKREALGVTDDLVRMSVGIEDPDDLLTDLQRALED